jgi:hypothetical protein
MSSVLRKIIVYVVLIIWGALTWMRDAYRGENKSVRGKVLRYNVLRGVRWGGNEIN